jgi:dihydroorotate dehydrogenase electron transfer subunit
VTRKDVNSARARIRLLLATFLSDYARELGFDATPGVRLKKKEPATAVSVRAKRIDRSPEPDITWLKHGKPVYHFHLLAPPDKLPRLSQGAGFASDMIICADSAGREGFIKPKDFLRFLEKESVQADRKQVRALLEEAPAVPPLSPKSQFVGIVVDNCEIVPDHFSLRMKADFAREPSPGQFLQVMCDPVAHKPEPRYRSIDYSDDEMPALRGFELLERRPFLRRPFSIASYSPAAGGSASGPERKFQKLITWLGAEFEIIFKRNPGGPGTEALARHRLGDEIDVVGPLGRGFTVEPVPERSVLVGGGIGSPPLVFLAEELVRRGSDVKVFLGALAKDKIPFRFADSNEGGIDRFEKLGIRPVICTDDGSAGVKALVTEPLLNYLERNPGVLSSTRIFACGPRPLLSALNGIADRFHLPCQALLEERMACGIGACISCVCAVKEPGQKAHFTRICVEGPAFDVKKVMWHA